MTEWLDVMTWTRRPQFEFFRDFDNPYFNICVQLEIGPLRAAARDANIPFFLAYHYAATRAANECRPFRYRLRGREQVIVHPAVDCSTTYRIDEERFVFLNLRWAARALDFSALAEQEIARVRREGATLPSADEDARDDTLHCSTLPWLAFTSVSHARRFGRLDSVPKLVFGKCEAKGDGWRMPVSIEVHHGLMDGVHVGRFCERLEHLFTDAGTLDHD